MFPFMSFLVPNFLYIFFIPCNWLPGHLFIHLVLFYPTLTWEFSVQHLQPNLNKQALLGLSNSLNPEINLTHCPLGECLDLQSPNKKWVPDVTQWAKPKRSRIIWFFPNNCTDYSTVIQRNSHLAAMILQLTSRACLVIISVPLRILKFHVW